MGVWRLPAAGFQQFRLSESCVFSRRLRHRLWYEIGHSLPPVFFFVKGETAKKQKWDQKLASKTKNGQKKKPPNGGFCG